jgi:membrane protein YdbS with pleckstrin-like domain
LAEDQRPDPVSGDEPEVEHDFQPDGVDHELDPNWVLVTRLGSGIFVAVLAIVTIVGLMISVFLSDWRGPSVLIAFAGWFVLVTLIATVTQVLPAKRYTRRRYRLSETELRIRRGLLFHVEISVPYSRIQHTDVSRGPIERSFGLATLIVHTAGTESASVMLDGLPAARAYRIRDLLLREVESGDAV